MHNQPPLWTSVVSLLGFVSAEWVAYWSAWWGLIMSVVVSIWTTICIAGWAWAKIRKWRGLPPGAANLLALALLAPLFFGCATQPHESAPVPGGYYEKTTHPDGRVTERVSQGFNAASVTQYISLPDGTLRLVFGRAFASLVTLPPVPDNAHYYVAGAGVVAMLGSGALFYFGWPRIGCTVLLTGLVVLVVGLTVREYGLLWAVAVMLGGAVVAWREIGAYSKGKLEGRAAA